MHKKISRDIVIAGGGIVGCSLARALALRHPTKRILVLEKEEDVGLHASTRNSGVLHAGFYYSRDSLKTRFCKEGNRLMTAYCKDNRIPLLECGKLVIPTNETEEKTLLKIYEQGIKNEVKLELLTLEQAKKIEPHLKVSNPKLQCIFSPMTKATNPIPIMQRLKKDLQSLKNCEILFRNGYKHLISNKENSVVFETINGQHIESGFFINAAGMYADKIAHDFKVGEEYAVFPMKGLFIYEPATLNLPKLNTLVYPVPPIQANYFLGVHFCLTAEGKTKVGPTAIPCFWREQYGLLSNFKLNELIELLKQTKTHLLSPERKLYFNLLRDQMKKYYKSYMLRDAAKLADIYDQLPKDLLGLPSSAGFTWSKPGIRSQLIDKKSRKIEQDFKYVISDTNLQILNIVSPGYTASFALAQEFSELVSNRLAAGSK